jgi:hypothetical protein
MEPVKGEREAFEKQAKAILEGRDTWRPTWQALGLNYGKPVVPNFGNAKVLSHHSPSMSEKSDSELQLPTSESQSEGSSR